MPDHGPVGLLVAAVLWLSAVAVVVVLGMDWSESSAVVVRRVRRARWGAVALAAALLLGGIAVVIINPI